MEIFIYDKSDALLSTINEYEGLSIESSNPGGYSVARFTIHRPVTTYWQEFEPFNPIKIIHQDRAVWEGTIDKPEKRINPDAIDVQCTGWSSQLNELGTTSDVTVSGVANNQASDFITNVIFADSDILIIEGSVETSDYAYPVNTRFEFSKYTSYFDCLERFNAGNNYDYGVWEDRSFYWQPKTPTVIDWLVYVDDCTELQISPNPEELCNHVIASYTQDGVHQQVVTSTDTASQTQYRIIKKLIDIPGKITTAGAQQVADTYIADKATLRVSAEFTCNRIFDINGISQPLSFVRAGDNVRLIEWLPTEERLRLGVTDISTFQIKSTTYEHDTATLRITPTEWVSQIEVKLARLEATGY